MGKLLYILRYVFTLFSADKNESRRHIHVKDNEKSCKFWLEPEIALAYNEGYSEKEIKLILSLIVEYKDEIDKQIELFFTEGRVSAIRINHGNSLRNPNK